MKIKQFRVDGVPVPQGSMMAWNNRVVHVQSKRLKEWRNLIAKASALQPVTGAVSVDLVFYLPKPKTVTRSMPSVRPDVDKLCRAVLDALTGCAYIDDAQVVNLTATKAYGEPGVEVMISFHEQD